MGDVEPPHIQLGIYTSSSMTAMNLIVNVRSHSNGRATCFHYLTGLVISWQGH